MKEIELYPDQKEFVASIRQALKDGNQSVLGVASTGMGKTIVSAFIAKSAADRGKRVWFLCHLKNLLTQTSKAFWTIGIQHGLIASGKSRSYLPVQVATIGTLGRRIETMDPPDVMIVDECHLAMAATWVKVIEWARDSGCIIVGNSATPCRLDGKGLDYLFDEMVEARPMRWLIEHGRLSDYVIYSAPHQADLSEVKKRAGDYATGELEAAMDKPQLIGDAADHWKRYANGLRTICYCISIKHSKHTADHFNANGIPAIHVDGETPQEELKRAIAGFADGKYMVLCNVQLMTTGFDLSAQVDREVPIEAAILLRPTKSVALYMQMVGRALRKKPRPAVILDHAGMAMEHGLPDDERQWSLEGVEKQKRKKKDDEEEPEPTVQWCKQCYFVFRVGPDACPSCGAPVEKQERKINQVDGELVEIDPEELRRQRQARIERARAQTVEDLVATGMKPGQAKHVLAAREEKANLRNELAGLVKEYRSAGRDPIEDLGFGVTDISPMKPKQLRESIEAVRERLTG